MANVLLEEVLALVELQMGLHAVSGGDRFMEDLSLESSDIANLAAAAEQKYAITIKESELARLLTPQDLFEIIRQRL